MSHRPTPPDRWYLVVRGSRVCFASSERCLAEAYFHGQESNTSVLLCAEMLLPTGGFEAVVAHNATATEG
jgi:hypothetical protein